MARPVIRFIPRIAWRTWTSSTRRSSRSSRTIPKWMADVHRAFCQRLFAEEVAACNRGPLRRRLGRDVELDGPGTVVVQVEAPAGFPHVLTLTGDNYNAEPLSLMAV